VGLRKPTSRCAAVYDGSAFDKRPKTHQNHGLLDATLQFMNNPGQDLIPGVESMAVLHDSAHPNLQQMLATTQLAALPQSAIRLLELSRDPNSGPCDYAGPIEADPGLAGQVLKFVNSSYFGFSRKISSVKVGISLVGVRTIKNFALWNAVFSLAANPRCGPFDLKSIWQDSLRRALFARAVAKLRGLKSTEEIFTAALLQDMTVPLLAKEFPQVYVKLLEARDQGRRRLSSLEGETFGWTHGQAAGMLVRQWKLSEEFAALIEGHCGAGTIPDDPGIRIVSLSALLPSAADPLWIECSQWEEALGQIHPSSLASPASLLNQVDEEFTEFAPVLKLSALGKTLVESHQEAVVPA
jgi:HD-like signal output (HDOD) protein